jgi:hypothetical protein
MNSAVVGIALSGLLGYQEARQGKVVPVERFQSPMVLDLPMVVGPTGVWTSALRTPEERARTHRIICDGAYVFDLTLKAGKADRQDDVEVDGKLTLAAEHGQDKRVDVLAEIVKGDEALATSPKITQLKVEEDERSTRPLTFHLSGAHLKDWSGLKVRLTLEVVTPP